MKTNFRSSGGGGGGGGVVSGGTNLPSLPTTGSIANPDTATIPVVINGTAYQISASAFVAALGVSPNNLPAAGALADNNFLPIGQGVGSLSQVSLATLKSFLGTTGGGGTTTPPADTTKPTVSSAQVADSAKSSIVITFTETLADFTPDASTFAATRNGGAVAVTAVARSGATVTLTVASAYTAGESITVGYTKPASNALRDGAGNEVDSFVGRAVTNNVGVVAPVATALTLTGPTTGPASTTSSDFTVALSPVNGTVASPVTVTPTDNGGGGTFSPTSVTLSTGTPSAKFKYTPSSGIATRSIGVNNNGSLSAPTTISYAVTAPQATEASKYSLTQGTSALPASGTMTADGDKFRYGVSLSLRIRTPDNTGAPEAGTVKLVWGKSTTTPPCSYTDTIVPYGANGGSIGSTGNINSIKKGNRTGGWVNPGDSYYGLHSPESSLYAWGTAGTYYLWVLFSDGSSKVYDGGTGTPVGVVLSQP